MTIKILYIVLILVGIVVFYFTFRHFLRSHVVNDEELLDEPEGGFMSREELLIAGYKFRKMVPESNDAILTHEEIDRLARNIDNDELFEIIKNKIISNN